MRTNRCPIDTVIQPVIAYAEHALELIGHLMWVTFAIDRAPVGTEDVSGRACIDRQLDGP